MSAVSELIANQEIYQAVKHNLESLGKVRTVYLSGPMTGIPDDNYPAFMHAEDLIHGRHGYAVLNPAKNFDGEKGLSRPEYMRADLEMLLDADALVLIDGAGRWDKSVGVGREIENAIELGLPIYKLDEEQGHLIYVSITQDFSHQVIRVEEVPEEQPESTLEEAQRLIHGDRQGQYGHPYDDFSRTGRMWGAILGIPDVSPEKVGLMMDALKVSRAVNQLDLGDPIKRDTLVDGPGYWGTVDLVQQHRQALEQAQEAREWLGGTP
jgi:hypothetical protein